MWSLIELQNLAIMCNQINAFGSNEHDEFWIERENGNRQGIFKTWTVPVIPFLDRGNLRVLSKLWPQLTELTKKMGFWEALDWMRKNSNCQLRHDAAIASTTIKDWNANCGSNPARLYKSLERARIYSWILDKKLAVTFDKEKLLVNLPKRIEQLVSRLTLAFGLMNPFYNLEALVGEPTFLNGKAISNKNSTGGGLDIVSFLLPSALRNYVIAKPLDWNGLNWSKIDQATAVLLRESKTRKILVNLSRLTGVQPKHIVFAANALEWLPTRVGGKKNVRALSNQSSFRKDIKN